MKGVLKAIFIFLCAQIITPVASAGSDCPLHDTECTCSDQLKIQIKLLIKVSERLKFLASDELIQLQQPQVLQMLNCEIEKLNQNDKALITPDLLRTIQRVQVIQLQEMQCEAIL